MIYVSFIYQNIECTKSKQTPSEYFSIKAVVLITVSKNSDRKLLTGGCRDDSECKGKLMQGNAQSAILAAKWQQQNEHRSIQTT